MLDIGHINNNRTSDNVRHLTVDYNIMKDITINSRSGVWILVPARGGSKGIPRKNLRLLNHKPLIGHLLSELSKSFAKEQIIVSTDSQEISYLSTPYAVIHQRASHVTQDATTLDEVALVVAKWLMQRGAKKSDLLLTLQPTSPFLKIATVEKCIDILQTDAKSVITAKDDRHLRWTIDIADVAHPLYAERVNRQWLPPVFSETGGIIGTRIGDLLQSGTRIQEPIQLVVIDRYEGLDIDSYADWAVAEYYARRKNIVIRADANPSLGMGHVYRALALAHELNEHRLRLVTREDNDYQLGKEFLSKQPYDVTAISSDDDFLKFLSRHRFDLIILDVLDTSQLFVEQVKQYAKGVVSFEDLGAGAQLADLVINDLYTDFYPQESHWYGVDNAILSPHFETVEPRLLKKEVANILLAFGGTDPQNLTIKGLSSLEKIEFAGKVVVVLGPGYGFESIELSKYNLQGEVLYSVKNMAYIMSQADIALTSAGRTVTELMSLGIPTIVMCQNSRELRHTHASSPFGVINLGLGEHIEVSTLAQHILMLMNDEDLRKGMRSRALRAVNKRTNRRIVKRILEMFDF